MTTEQRRSRLMSRAIAGVKFHYDAWPHDRETLRSYIGIKITEAELDECERIIERFEAEDAVRIQEIHNKKAADLATEDLMRKLVDGGGR